MKRERTSFVFYRSFYEAINGLPKNVRLEVYDAIAQYALNGTEPEQLSAMARSMMLLVKPQIDVNQRRYENGCKGGRPNNEDVEANGENRKETEEKPKRNQKITKQKPKQNQTETETEAKNNQTETEQQPKDNQSETKAKPNVNDNDNEDRKKEPSKEGKKESEFLSASHSQSEDYQKFLRWVEKYAPYCFKNLTMVTEEEFERLKKSYKGEEIATVIAKIENRKDLRKTYTNLYRTILNWLRNEKK